MEVFIERTQQVCSSSAQTAEGLLKELKLNPDTVLVMRNGQLITEDEPLENTDTIKILSVISGG